MNVFFCMRDKKALSNLVAYVLLIAITISLSVMVYGWLKFYVETEDVEACPENVNIIIESYDCISGPSGSLTVVLKNKGLFDVDGFVLRVHNRTDAEFGFYVLDRIGGPMIPGQSLPMVYSFADSDQNPDELVNITLIEVQPFLSDGENVSCDVHASQRVTCS